MPLELVVVAPRTPAFREYTDPTPGPDQVLVTSEFTAAKHGTERGFYHGTAALTRGRMNEHNIYVRDESSTGPVFPIPLGNMTVGRVAAVGAAVTRWKPGQRVFLWAGFRQTHLVSQDKLWAAPEDMPAESIVYWDPAEFAYAGVVSGGVTLGCRVAVFGLGAIGLMAVQMARLSGATEIFAVDTYEIRRAAATRCGATAVLDPTACDAGRVIKESTAGQGVDVSLEASGAVPALQQSIRAAGRGGKIVTLGVYEGPATGLRLDEDWHRNQQVLIAARGGIGTPIYGQPTWSGERIRQTAFDLLRTGTVHAEGLVTPIVPFAQVAEAYREVDDHPERSIKLAVRY